MSAIPSQITSLTIVCSNVYSGADQRKHQSSASLAFVRRIHRWPVNSPHNGPVTRKMFHLMTSSCGLWPDCIIYFHIQRDVDSCAVLWLWATPWLPRPANGILASEIHVQLPILPFAKNDATDDIWYGISHQHLAVKWLSVVFHYLSRKYIGFLYASSLNRWLPYTKITHAGHCKPTSRLPVVKVVYNSWNDRMDNEWHYQIVIPTNVLLLQTKSWSTRQGYIFPCNYK